MAAKKKSSKKKTNKSSSNELILDSEFSLEAQDAPKAEVKSKKKSSKKKTASRKKKGAATDVLSYRHLDKRVNNPEVGMVKPENDPDQPHAVWKYDPHIDPELQFDIGRSQIEKLIDEALESGDDETMRTALQELKRLQQPYLNWTGKAERTSFEFDTVSLHVHERIDPASILAAVRKKMNEGNTKGAEKAVQPDLFAAPFENLPLRDAIDFYKHERGWANRLIAGDSLLVMNSLLQKESMSGQVQMIYIDPPYGIKYGSNFQPFVNKRDVKDRKDEDLTQEPEMIKAFRDTWELGIHSYLTYLRDRLLLAKDLLHESGSVFVQISDENLHHVRELLDEVFGPENFMSIISYASTGGFQTKYLSRLGDYLIWFGKDIKYTKYNQLYLEKENPLGNPQNRNDQLQLRNGFRRPLLKNEKDGVEQPPLNSKIFRYDNLLSQGAASETQKFEMYDRFFEPPVGSHWKANYPIGMERLRKSKRIELSGNRLTYVRYFESFPVQPINNSWLDIAGSVQSRTNPKIYAVQTGESIIERAMLMTTSPGDLVFDPTCGSGTTAQVAEKWARRWISCDTSRVSITLAKQRLMTSSFGYYQLKYPQEGVKSGFIYKTVPHVTLKSIANNSEIDEIYEGMHPLIVKALDELNLKAKQKYKEWEVPFDCPENLHDSAKSTFDAFHKARIEMQKMMDESIASHAGQEILYDKPAISKDKLRITGPFTVEAVPAPTVLSLDDSEKPHNADVAIARSGESLRQHEWRDELLRSGVRGKGGQVFSFAELETLPGSPHLHATGHLDNGERVVVSFGPEYAALEQRQVSLALSEAEKLRPSPKFIIFTAFEFDPEAQKDIDETKWPGVTLLRLKMDDDLHTHDLKKKKRTGQSFWLMGQPDVEVQKQKDGKYIVEVHGFDYFDTKSGELVSGGKNKIAAWMLDTDYDERSLFPQQVFFPMAGKKDGWNILKKDIKAELNESLLDKFHGTKSLPFDAGENNKVAVKIVDDRGIESLKIIVLD